jgi:hypothetical protein
MLAPIKIVLISTSLINCSVPKKPIILDGDYSIEAMRYRIKKDHDSKYDTNDILYKTIIQEIERDHK